MRAMKTLSAASLAMVVAVSTWLWWDTPGSGDVEIWLEWMRKLVSLGPRQGYVEIQGDYPPGASIVLWICGRVADHAAIDPRFVLKLTLLAWLLATTGLLLLACRRAALAAFVYAALVFNAFVLMYLDIFTAPFVLGAIWAARAGRMRLMAGLLVAASLFKWQPILLVPFAAIYVLRSPTETSDQRWRRFASAAAPAAILVFLVVAIYGFAAVHDSLNRAGHHNNLSSYAANPAWVLTWLFERTAEPGRQTLGTGGIMSIMAASRFEIRVSSLISLVGYVWILRRYWTSSDYGVGGFIRFALTGYLAYFLLSVGAHENHLFLASLLGIALVWVEPRRVWTTVILAVAANLNLAVFYGSQGLLIDRTINNVDVSVICAAAISIALAALGLRLIRRESNLRPA